MIDAFYSDPHFGHANIIEKCNRPFSNVDHMNEYLITVYNRKIRPNSLVVFLGDCFFGMSVDQAKFILDRMNGRKLLIRGGHDRSYSKMLRIGFETVADEMTTMISNRVFTLSHYPYAGVRHEIGEDDRYLELRPKRIKGRMLICGHVHTRWKKKDNMIHVGVDAWNYEPVTRKEIFELINE